MNVSVGVWDEDPEIAEVHAAVKEIVAAGVVVLAAVGNQPGVAPEAPANCAEAISVGGWNDGNTRDPGDDRWFPSSHGGGKPDLVATAIWLPAPMLPGTLEAREAAGLFQVVPVLEELMERDGFSARRRPPPEHERRTLEATLSAITERIRVRKFISPDYQHVEGTSFAAPITASVVAQMLEADPRLGPALVREGLLATAKRIEGVPKEIQGAGLLQPLAAVQWVDERKARAPTAPRS
jgi:serine protease AprX